MEMNISQTILLVLFLGAGAAYLWRKRQDNIQMRQKRQSYAERTAPIFVRADYPNDKTVEERVLEHKAMLEEVGNKWYAQGLIDVVGVHHNAYGHFGEDFYTQYPVRFGQFVTQYMNDFHKQMIKEDESAFKGAVLNQQGVQFGEELNN